jgi:putative CocE/NonD family hydrolase
MAGLAFALAACATALNAEKVSRPGAYEGYAHATYDGYVRQSFYITMRDGTKLAADLFRPTIKGKLAHERLPVVWMHTPYNRRSYNGGAAAEKYPGFALRLASYGYNVAVVDFRGLYASYGKNRAYNRGEWLDEAKMDAYDVTEWFAKQPWSNGKIGMWGCSATGGSQMQAATTAPPSLKAIFPMSCEWDGYALVALGGLVGPDAPTPGGSAAARDKMAAPVDGPNGAAELAAAIAGHKDNIEASGSPAHRDDISPTLGLAWWVKSSPLAGAAAVKDSHVAIYAAANWNEAATKYGAFFIFKNLPDQTKLIIGPGTHCAWSYVKDTTGFDIVTEELRFFDHWLKGVDNGVMAEPRVTYYTYNAPAGGEWRQSNVWPLANEARTAFYLDGEALGRAAPAGAGSQEVAVNAPIGAVMPTVAPPKRERDAVVSYSTPALAADMEITGHPVLDLWISADVADADIVATIEDVAPDGTATSYNMHGQIRASRRALGTAPYDNLGLPWHSHNRADDRPLTPGQPAEIAFDLLPMSYIFKAGHRVRLTLTFAQVGADAAPGRITVLTGAAHASKLTLPIIPAAG